MIHTNRSTYKKPISHLNKKFPIGFRTIYFRLLPDDIKLQIISNKINQMGRIEFKDICSQLNFTVDDIHEERHQLEEFQSSLSLKMKDTLEMAKRNGKKIKQKEFDNLRLRLDLFNHNLDKEYNRIFPLLTQMIKKVKYIKELVKINMKNNRIIFNLQTVMEADVKKLNDERKELLLALRGNEDLSSTTVQEHQSKIKKLKTFICNYVKQVYEPIIKKHKALLHNTDTKLEQFLFTVVDDINEKMEKIKIKHHLDMQNFYFDDGLELCLTVKNKFPSKYPIKILHFNDLDTPLKKRIIQILRSQL